MGEEGHCGGRSEVFVSVGAHWPGRGRGPRCSIGVEPCICTPPPSSPENLLEMCSNCRYQAPPPESLIQPWVEPGNCLTTAWGRMTI